MPFHPTFSVQKTEMKMWKKPSAIFLLNFSFWISNPIWLKTLIYHGWIREFLNMDLNRVVDLYFPKFQTPSLFFCTKSIFLSCNFQLLEKLQNDFSFCNVELMKPSIKQQPNTLNTISQLMCSLCAHLFFCFVFQIQLY